MESPTLSEQNALFLLRTVETSMGVKLVAGSRPDIEAIDQWLPRASHGEHVLINLALDIWRGTGIVADLARLDPVNRKIVLTALVSVCGS